MSRCHKTLWWIWWARWWHCYIKNQGIRNYFSRDYRVRVCYILHQLHIISKHYYLMQFRSLCCCDLSFSALDSSYAVYIVFWKGKAISPICSEEWTGPTDRSRANTARPSTHLDSQTQFGTESGAWCLPFPRTRPVYAHQYTINTLRHTHHIIK